MACVENPSEAENAPLQDSSFSRSNLLLLLSKLTCTPTSPSLHQRLSLPVVYSLSGVYGSCYHHWTLGSERVKAKSSIFFVRSNQTVTGWHAFFLCLLCQARATPSVAVLFVDRHRTSTAVVALVYCHCSSSCAMSQSKWTPLPLQHYWIKMITNSSRSRSSIITSKMAATRIGRTH